MSTTSFCYHTLGTVNYQYLRTKYNGDTIYIHLEKKRDKQYCANCKSYNVSQKGRRYREIRTLPIGKKSIILCLHLHRLHCYDCGSVLLEVIEIAAPKKHYSKKTGNLGDRLAEICDNKGCSQNYRLELGTSQRY